MAISKSFIDTGKLADELEKHIISEFHDEIADLDIVNDVSMQRMYIMDTSDALDICRSIRHNEFTAARQKLFGMDTAPREKVHSIIEQVAGEDFLDTVD